MNRDLLIERMHASALSLWELGDLLGIHPHHLHTGDNAGSLYHQPVYVLIELARRLDMHPADLVAGLEPVLANRRATTTSATPDLDRDALTVLTALATTTAPMTVDDLATALTWTLDRTAAALNHAVDQPHLGGPVALRRAADTTWTVTARRDVLTPEQQTNLAQTTSYRSSLNTEEASVLLAAYRFGNGPNYATWRQHHLDAEHRLKEAGLLHSHNGPHHARPSDDVYFSIANLPPATGED